MNDFYEVLSVILVGSYNGLQWFPKYIKSYQFKLPVDWTENHFKIIPKHL